MKKLCCLNENQLYRILHQYLVSLGYKVNTQKEYIMAEGELPICLIAHMDTVFINIPIMEGFIYDPIQQILWYPYGAGFDDRAGIYIIMQLLEKGYRPSLIFTNGEERGGIGSYEIIKDYPKCPFSHCKALIQLDRANQNDCVFYDCDNKKFEEYISSFGFKTDIGTFSDISIIAPQWQIAAVNLSVGYVDEHDVNERLYCTWCEATIERTERILQNVWSMDYFKYEGKNHFTVDLNTCLMCGNALTPDKSHDIHIGGMFPYAVCNECYHRYYE